MLIFIFFLWNQFLWNGKYLLSKENLNHKKVWYMYIELRNDYQGLILPIPMVVYMMDTFISTDFCFKKIA